MRQDAILLENMHDVPYLHTESVGPEISAAMAVVCAKVRQVFLHGPVGIQVLSGANHTALAVAKAAGETMEPSSDAITFMSTIYL